MKPHLLLSSAMRRAASSSGRALSDGVGHNARYGHLLAHPNLIPMKTNPYPKPPVARPYGSTLASLLVLLTAIAFGQTVPRPASQPSTPSTDETIVLSPFEVRASSDIGYQATETLAGSRLNSQLKDVATPISVMTPEFLQDLGIGDLEDAVRYSLNGENYEDTAPIEAPANTNLRDTIGYGANTTRTRNQTNANITHDFFDTNIRVDGYNTERFTFASGPNSILFGNSSAGGTVDTTFKRASLVRHHYSASAQVDDLGSLRTVVDVDQPLIKDRLGLRFVQLRDRDKDWREPAFNNQDRYFVALTFKPIEKVMIRGYYERVFNHLQTPMNTTMQDHITPWIEAGKPIYNNGTTALGGTLPPAASSIFARRQPATGANSLRPYIFLDGAGSAGAMSQQHNTVDAIGYDTLLAPPNNFEHSILDESLFPYDVSPAGNGNQSKVAAWIRGVSVEINPLKNLFIEVAGNQEEVWQRGSYLFRGTDMDLRVDANQYLNDRVTPNPNVGRYYIESNMDAGTSFRTNYSTRDQWRLSVAYELDFTKQKDTWTRWFGRHRIAGLYEELDSVSANQNQSYRLVNNGTVGYTGAESPIFRYYLTPGEKPYARVPFDPLAAGVQTLPGVNSAGQPLQIVGWDSPFGAQAAASGNRKRQFSTSFALQSWLLDDRVVLNYGRRRDHVQLFEDDPSRVELLPGFNEPLRNAITGARLANQPFIPLSALLESETGLNWGKTKDEAPVSSLTGVVVHPLRWLSLAYSKSDSTIVGTGLPRKLDGIVAPPQAAEGEEFGFTLRFLNDRLTLRYTNYKVTNANVTSAYSLNNPVGQLAANWGSNIRHNIASIDRSIQLATGQTGTSAKYQWFLDTLTRIPDGGVSTSDDAFGVGHNDLAFQSARVSKGEEVTLVGNLTDGWRLSLSLAKSESEESSIAPEYQDYLMERIPVWEQYLDTPLRINNPPLVGANTATIRQLLEGGMLRNMNFIKYGEGKPLAREREYRVTLVSSYRFKKGWAKGANVGGAYMWRSPAAVGYPELVQTNFYPITGVAEGNLTLDDQNNPYRDGEQVTVDAFCGYERKLFKGQINWRVQLNVRNVLGKDDAEVQRVMNNGEAAIYRIPAPSTFILTNTFEF